MARLEICPLSVTTRQNDHSLQTCSYPFSKKISLLCFSKNFTSYISFSFFCVSHDLIALLILFARLVMSDTSSRKFHLNIKLNQEYATTRSVYQRSLSCANEAQHLRNEGKKHIDLWTDGSLYPPDPKTGRYPSFHTPHDLIRFVGDGEDGLLGYSSRLSQSHINYAEYTTYLQNTSSLNATKILELENEIVSLKQENDQLKSLKETPIGLRARVKRMRDVVNLIERSGQRKKKLKLVRDHVTNLLGFDMSNA